MSPNTFDEACRAVLDEPDHSHSLYTTLAPLYDRMLASADDQYETRRDRLREHAPDARSMLEIGCGTGRLLAVCESEVETVVGIDLHVELLELAARRVERAELVRADATNCALGRSFDAVCAVGYVTAHLRTDAEVRAFLDTAYEHLRPGGVLVFDAVVDPVAVYEEPIGVYRSANYQLERAVDSIPMPDFSGTSLRIDYRVTDRETDRRETTTERIAVRTYSSEELRRFLAVAGFVDIDIDSGSGDEGAIVAVAYRPES